MEVKLFSNRMFAKIMHHFVFLIITFSPFAACIRNENLIDKPKSNLSFQSTSGVLYKPNSDVKAVRGRNLFVFEGNSTNRYDDTAARTRSSDLYHSSNYGPQSLHNMELNEHEVMPSYSSNNNYHQYQHFAHMPSQTNRFQPNLSKYHYRLTHPNSNYMQQSYGQTHGNYIYNKVPNYYKPISISPTPPPPAPQSVQSSYSTPIPNQPQQSYQNDDERFEGGTFSLLGGQFGNFPITNVLTSLFGQPGGATNSQLGGQLIKGLESIARNDDLHCVPKLLCQMLGNPQRRAQLPAIITSPAIQSLIAVLPVTSPILAYGRAALLGLSGGESGCHATYPKCPRNEDDILYYLNNHRGGFFRYFSETSLTNQPSNNLQSTSTPSSSLSEFGEGSGFSSGISNLLGNILTGLVGGVGISNQNFRARRTLSTPNSRTKDLQKNAEARILNKGGREEDGHNEKLSDNVRFMSPVNTDVLNFNPGQFVGSPTLKFPRDDYGHKGLRYGDNNFVTDSKESVRDNTSNRQTMIFPDSDRTGTGNLRFDNEHFFSFNGNKVQPRPVSGFSGGSASSSGNHYIPQNSYSPHNVPSLLKSSYLRTTTARPGNADQNIYVTNSNGVVEYYINSIGKKVYI